MSSVGGVNGTGSSYAYAASKSALNTLTLALARNLAPGVYVGVRPGREPGSYDATVQVEVAPRLRVETDIGAAATGRVIVAMAGDMSVTADVQRYHR